MTYRGKVSNGVIVLEEGSLPEGTPVDITPRDAADQSRADDLPGFGIWRDREDMTDSAQASLDLRAKAEARV
jgi:hypothetical protein